MARWVIKSKDLYPIMSMLSALGMSVEKNSMQCGECV